MKRKITLNIEPFSINALHYANKSHGLTAKAKEWTYQVFHQLSHVDNKKALAELRNHFDPKLHTYSVSIIVTYPENQFWNKQGTVSARTQDCSNFEKPLLDLVFLDKNFGTNVPYECENLNTDDRYITQMFSMKKSGAAPKIEMRIGIRAFGRK